MQLLFYSSVNSVFSVANVLFFLGAFASLREMIFLFRRHRPVSARA